MKNNKGLLKSLSIAGLVGFPLGLKIVKEAQEYENTIGEICSITNKSREEVLEFCKNSDMSLEIIKQGISLGAKLDRKEIIESLMKCFL